MKVLVVTFIYPSPENPLDGIFIKEQVDSLKKSRVNIDVFVIKGKLRNLTFISDIPALWKQIRCKYDLIHAHYGTAGWIGRMQTQAPLLITFHGDDVLGTPNIKDKTTWRSQLLVYSHKVLARISNIVIVQSNEMKTQLGLPKALVIPHGVDLDLFKPISRVEACKQLNIDPAKQYVLFTNNPELPVKNFALAKEAFKTVKQKIPLTELVVLWKQPRNIVPLYLSACNVILLTSLHEGASLVIKEAMACNLPIVSVDVGDVKEVIKDTKNCFITSRNPNEMAERIIQILNSGERSNGREHIGHLEINKVAQRIIEIYKKICHAKDRSA